VTSLKDWFSRNAERPLVWVVGAVFIAQIGYLGLLGYARYSEQVEMIDRVVETASLGIQQANRPLVESALIAGLEALDAANVALCRGDTAELLYPPSNVDPCAAMPRNPFRWTVRRHAVGVAGNDVAFVLAPARTHAPLGGILLLSGALLAAVVLLLTRARRRFQSEVLEPLYEGLNEETALNIRELDLLRQRNQERNALARRQAVSDALVKFSAQVAHDIRSPLAVLADAVGTASRLAEGDRAAAGTALHRLRDIANNLIERYRHMPKAASADGEAGPPLPPSEPAGVHLLASLIGPVVSEKRLEYRSKEGVSIEYQLEPATCGVFVQVQPVEFSRVLSNLINNAVEALEGRGVVKIGVTSDGGRAGVQIRDTGRGIPEGLLETLGRPGSTHGKPGGAGLGLYHARKSAERWRGSLMIESTVSRGTTVTLSLPEAQAPSWFAGELAFDPDAPVVVVDDEPSIHELWDRRFARLDTPVEVIHLTTPGQLRQWVLENPGHAATAVFLVDHEFLGYQDSGLDLIRELNLGKRAVLVTGQFGDRDVLPSCIEIGVRALSKDLAFAVPLSAVVPATS